MNAPKKIWFDLEECSAGPVQFSDDEIAYIRADLVAELVEAANIVTKVLFNGKSSRDKADFWMLRDALKKLEESHD